MQAAWQQIALLDYADVFTSPLFLSNLCSMNENIHEINRLDMLVVQLDFLV
jgi:hypothetical protein